MHQELACLLKHPLFARAKVLRDILVFLTESAMAKQRVDESILANQVLAIPADEFHPYRNSNVRVQLRNLRLKLDAYYLANPDAPLRFRLMGYEVVFELAESIPNSARRAINEARYLLDSRFPEDLHHAGRVLEAVLQTHPRCGTAWEVLNYMQVSMAVHGAGPPRRCLLLAEESADRALEYGPSSGQAHAAKASVEAFLHWRWAEAAGLYSRAVSLADAVKFDGWYQAYLVAIGNPQQSVDIIEQSMCALDRPLPSYQTNLGVSQYLCRRFDAAEAELERAHKVNPDDWSALAWLAVVQWNRGNHVKAAYTQAKATLLARRSPPQQYFEFANEGLLGAPRTIRFAEEHRGGSARWAPWWRQRSSTIGTAPSMLWRECTKPVIHSRTSFRRHRCSIRCGGSLGFAISSPRLGSRSRDMPLVRSRLNTL